MSNIKGKARHSAASHPPPLSASQGEGDVSGATAATAVPSRMPAETANPSREPWRVEIEAGLADANRGDFATETEIGVVLGKYLWS